MNLREVGALFLVLLTACSGVPRVAHPQMDAEQAQLAAARYELRVLTAETGQPAPVVVSKQDFQKAMRMLAAEIPLSAQPSETARWLMEGELRADLRADVDRGRVVRLMPLEDGTPLEAASAAEIARRAHLLCQEDFGGGDCLGLFSDGPVLTRADLRTLALALSLRHVLKETKVALQDMVSPQALVSMVVWTGCFYLLLWLLPEPVSKALAASLTLALLAWIPAKMLWSLMDGWAALVHAVDRATSYAQIEQAAERFRKLMGENTAQALVMLLSAAVAGGAAKFASKLPKLPGFGRAAEWDEAQGLKLGRAGEVEAVAAAEERTFTLMVRRPDGRATAVAEEAAEARVGFTTIIRHLGGNRQVFFNGQRWHVPANRSIKDIPLKDPIGAALQAAAKRIAKDWSSAKLTVQLQGASDGTPVPWAMGRESLERSVHTAPVEPHRRGRS
ncbi:MAG TPA: hypothetical protein VNA24_16995 [Hyalangium sp.]|nr:hypothetical protein [Hyalangium sp.]